MKAVSCSIGSSESIGTSPAASFFFTSILGDWFDVSWMRDKPAGRGGPEPSALSYIRIC